VSLVVTTCLLVMSSYAVDADSNDSTNDKVKVQNKPNVIQLIDDGISHKSNSECL
jgi:hypothetical protein